MEYTIRGVGSRYYSFKSAALSKYGKAWMYFIYAHSDPNLHLRTILLPPANLLFSVISEISIDIATILSQSIFQDITWGTSTGSKHPSLISALCSLASRTWPTDEPTLAPLHPIDHRIIDLFEQ